MFDTYLLTMHDFWRILQTTMNFNYEHWKITTRRIMIQNRISTAIKKIETITESLSFFADAKVEEEEALKNLISTLVHKHLSTKDLRLR